MSVHPPLLAVRGLSVSYGKVAAIPDLSLDVRAGEIATIIGPNGAGKTTLLSALMGVLPSVGAITFDGIDITRLEVEDRLALGLALVPERRELFGDMTVADNLLLGLYLMRGTAIERRARFDEVYALFPRLAERRGQRSDTLSGGERQMLALGRALMCRPKLLMLDEPSLGLAPLIVREIFRIIAGLKAAGVSVLLVEQNARAALETADIGHVLETGEITLTGAARDLLGDPRVTATYLGGDG
jgi:branched-chain amino acid transport system ATP-binding protein